MTMPDPPVDTVKSVSVTGAKIMHGTWPNGETRVQISTAIPYDSIDAGCMIENGELPQ